MTGLDVPEGMEVRQCSCGALFAIPFNTNQRRCCRCRAQARKERKLIMQSREPLHANAIQSLEQLESYFAQPQLECLICGEKADYLGRHVAKHNLTAREYKVMMNIPVTRGLVSGAAREKSLQGARTTQALMADGGNQNLVHAREVLKEKRDAGMKRLKWPTYYLEKHVECLTSSPHHPSNLEGMATVVCTKCGTPFSMSAKVAVAKQCVALCPSCK